MINNFDGAYEAVYPAGYASYLEGEKPPAAQLKAVEDDGKYGKFTIEPVATGWGATIGNAMRRVLLGGINGAAVTWVKIEGVNHEMTTVPYIHEEVNALIDNIKGIQLRPSVSRPARLRLDARGKGEVKAGDMMASSDIEIMNPEHHLAYLEDDQAIFHLELNIETGVGYREAAHSKDHSIGTIPIDAVFSPILRVAYDVEPRRYQNFTDLECLTLEVWTNSAMAPTDAVKKAASLMIEQLNVIIDEGGGESAVARSNISPEVFGRALGALDMSARTYNALARAGYNRIGEIIGIPRDKLLSIRNFGQKSFDELVQKMDELNVDHTWGSPKGASKKDAEAEEEKEEESAED